MKLKLVDVYESSDPEHGFDKTGNFRFKDSGGHTYKATVRGGIHNLDVVRRWYNLTCAWVGRERERTEIWIELLTDPVPFCYDLDPNADFKIEKVDLPPTVYVPPARRLPENRERHRRDLHD